MQIGRARMQYRKLGNTGVEVSCIGLGCAQLGSSEMDYAVRIVHKALEMGVNYFDTARSYWDSEVKLGQALKGARSGVFVSSKTGAKTRQEAWQHLRESLDRLQTDYLDNYHLHGLADEDDVRVRTGPGGALEALVEAKEQGLIRHVGCTAHMSRTLLQALERFPFEIILVPMNIVEREPMDELIPVCQERGVGVTIMKPVATGLLPAGLALKWLLNQPIATAVPGATKVEEAEENSLVGHMEDVGLTDDERSQVVHWADDLNGVRCRICRLCEPCPVGIPIGATLGTDVMYDHYRTMGPEAFVAFPWSLARVEQDTQRRTQTVQQIESCDGCGLCEERCPYHLPIVRMLRDTLPAMRDMLSIWARLQRQSSL
jgi:aryl-alcohol dehydrogenase-like predicted oxidoreductase/NAD-dependent dihydropyrimidine dehydrogenase PreA subunit